MKSSVIVSDTPETLADRAAADFAALVKETLAQKDRFIAALPGGNTPKLFFARLTQDPYRNQIPWEKIWIFWGDERCVPPDHPESNFAVAKQHLLEKVPVSSAHVFRIRGEDPPGETARAYSKSMHDFFKTEGWPVFDLILLGMGADGHTASLMPGTAALDEERRWVVENVVRSLQTVRITITLPVINNARQVWFMVAGAKKAAVFAKTQAGPDPAYPASLVEPESGELRWYVDKAVTG
jgi:6-phosphogluconolactonase